MPDTEKIVEILSELRNFADNDVHPVVSPENWYVYSKLRDLIDQAEADALTLLKEQEAVEPYGMNAERTYGICPKCGKIVFRYGNVVEENHYCGVCGQAVKWE